MRRPHAIAAWGLACALLGAVPLHAGATPTGELQMPQGNTAGTANGDYVTAATGGLNTSYHYWIEVPPALGRLVVEVFDADVGRGGAADEAGTRDRARNTTYTTNVTYTLVRPDGTTAATVNCGVGTCPDNAWNTILNSNTAQNTAAGHWELRVAMAAGDDINGIGIRANDGTAGGGGTELNIYADSIFSIGVHPPASGTNIHNYTLYPYLTSGCSAGENDFDYDADSGNVGSIALTSRGGAFSQTIATASLADNDTWTRNNLTGWTSDQLSDGYGLWTMAAQIRSYNNGGQNGNYADIYLSNFQAAGNPPTANPPVNSFRIYQPNDGGGAPAKAYLKQTLTYGGCGGGNNGPNPPAVGQTSCFTVTVQMVNPEAQAITFSATNLVTANVPGGRVVYAGLATVSQGSITAQPAVGGSGNVTWNPGTLGAGTSALLAYRLKVTPTAGGQRNPMTATPASGNGTRAQYVDNTGNTTQARARYVFGPLCELATTVSTITEALVSDFRAYEDGGAVAIEWQTASEAGTVGFYLERLDPATRRFARVSGFLPGLLQSPEGGVYRFVDPTASTRTAAARYRLIEVLANGGRRRLGPFDVELDWERGASATFTGQAFERVAHGKPRATIRRVEPAAGAAIATGPAPSKRDSLRIGVTETGIQYVPATAIASAFAVDLEKAEKLIGEGKLALSKQGRTVAWLAAPPTRKQHSAGLYFYGEAIHDLHTPDEAYRLRRENGTTMASVAVGAGSGGASDTFPDVLHVERDAFPVTALALDPESDYWMWDFVQAGDPTFGVRTFAFDAPAVGTGGASLRVHLLGATSSGVAQEHHVQISLNGTPLGEQTWTGIAAADVTLPLGAAPLLATANQLQVTGVLDGGVPYSIFYVDYAELSYPRTYTAGGDALAFRSAGHAALAVDGFSSSDVRLFEIGDPLLPRVLTGAAAASTASGFSIAFTPPAGSTSFVAVGPNGAKTPTVRPWVNAQLEKGSNGADYLVVTTAGLANAARRLASLREAQGLRTAVVDVEAVMNEFNGGRSNPHALHDFLAYAAAHWSPAPRYVALVGDGSLDERNLLGFGDSLVPTLVVSTPSGLFGSDNRLADFVGNDGLPELSIGRIPVANAAELDAYVDKIAAFESDAGSWAGSFLSLADAPDGEASFSSDSESIVAQLGSAYLPSRAYLDVLPLATARATVFDRFAAGTAFIDYLGHGGLDRLSAGGLLTSADAVTLTNGPRLPVLTAMTCTVNRFTVPGIRPLGALLVNRAGGGAAAVWSPSALSIHADAKLLAQKFYGIVARGEAPRIGDAVREALTAFKDAGGNPSMLEIYVLLGDPALETKAAPPPVQDPPGPPVGGLE